MERIAVFASGNGSNLQALIEGVRAGTIPAVIALVLSDRADAYALERGRKAGIETRFVDRKSFPSREAFDAALLAEVNGRKVGWVVLAGFMRILTPDFVRPLAGRIVNIHPALLPKYPGTHSIERALEAGERETGVTVHLVDEGVDTGPILRQEKLEIRPGETLEGLTERVHQLEHEVYPRVVAELVTGTIRIPKGTR